MENVKNNGESIAVSAMKKLMVYSGNAFNDLYRMLVHDFYGKNLADIYSHGYDIASEVICFLCQYIGNNLTDMICKDKHGKVNCCHNNFQIITQHSWVYFPV